ncbi:MAG: L-threonylcarbamoyladenylate synthase [Pseudomonadota bacterium]
MRPTRVLAPDMDGLASAVETLRGGGLVAFPTETVYGLGADARDDRAVAGIFAAKDRPQFNPLIVHVASLAEAETWVALPDPLMRLAQAFWPGPLSLVAPVRTGLSDLVTAGLPTVAVRVPAHPVARALLAAFDGPLAAPSANPSGRVSPTTAEHVLTGLSGRIDAVVDGGPCSVGLESTIVGIAGPQPVLLRPGGVPVEALEACIGAPVQQRVGHAITAPGQLESHYAPAARLRLGAEAPRAGEIWLGFGGGPVDPEAGLSLSPNGDLTEAAARLFAALRHLDRPGGRIAVAPIPDHGLGLAINDRLRRAAADRGSAETR